MDLSTIKGLYVGATPAQSVWLGGTKVWERRPAVDIQSIFDAMVLWYDPKRQGATNENMAENPVLTDLSGNGHDATCYNFAWNGMSGVGGYPADNSNMNIQSNRAEWINSYTLKTTNAVDGNLIAQGTTIKGEQGQPFLVSTKEVHIRVSGLTEGQSVTINHGLNNGNSTTWVIDVTVSTNGEYTIPSLNEVIEPYDTNSTPSYTNNRFTVKGTDIINNIIIEFLPEYPDALVADGVDDYVKVEGLPILTDYTVIAKRKILSELDGTYKTFAAQGTTSYQGAFILERQTNTNKYEIYSFGQSSTPTEIPTDITYITSNSYNGNPIAKGDGIDEDIVHIFSRDDQNQCISAVLYSFILFNRTLTEEEINWVKTNLIEGTYRNPEALLIDAWIFSGHTNEEAPTQITGEKGTALNCYNFAWNEEGSGFKDGELCFDGVDDYLMNENMPLLDDFTVIMRRTASGDAGAVVYKGPGGNYDAGRGGAFQLEILFNGNTAIVNYLFGKSVVFNDMGKITLKDEAVSFTPTSIYNGLEYEQNFERVPKEDGPVLKINSPLNRNNYYTIKMKYFALYSKTLTDEEIQSEKQRLDALWESRKQ